MQVIKEELRALILEKAEAEFLQNGFEHASLRKIAKESSTTIGNIYHYFANKEALFDELVRNEYIAFLHLMQHNENQLSPMVNPANTTVVWRDLFREYMSELMPVFSKRFLLLVDRSRNTPYESARESILQMLAQHFDDHFTAYGIAIVPGFAAVLAEQLLAGLLYIIETCKVNDQKQQLIGDMFAFFIEGALHF